MQGLTQANKYYTGITGEVVCVGLAHDKKKCSMNYKTMKIPG